jgi:hypothetical protein
MEFKMKKFIALAALGLSFSINSHALTIDLIPSAAQLNLGDTLELQANISGLKTLNAPALGVYDLNINYDSSRFAVSSINWGDNIKGNQLDINHLGNLQLSDNSNSNWLNLLELSFDSAWDLETLQASSFTLFSIVFSSITAGTGVFSVDVNALGDAYGNSLTVDSINNTRATIKAVTVPEPTANFLIFIGLVALGFARIKKQY